MVAEATATGVRHCLGIGGALTVQRGLVSTAFRGRMRRLRRGAIGIDWRHLALDTIRCLAPVA
jgi:hypothetical protein